MNASDSPPAMKEATAAKEPAAGQRMILDNLAKQRLKGFPTELGSGFAHSAAVNAFRVRPQAATAGMSKQIADLGIDALVLTAGDKG